MLKAYYKLFLIVVVSVFMTHTVYAQHEIGKYQYRWAFFRPIAALKVKRKLPSAMLVYKAVKSEKLLDTLENGGLLDAFRHTYTMAYLTTFVKVKKLRKLGKAHEKDNKRSFFKNMLEFGERADSLSCVMDLKNNELGFLIGEKTNNNIELKNIVITEIIKGYAWYIKKNKNGQYITCNNQVINFNDYKQQWFLPKCLVKTNE